MGSSSETANMNKNSLLLIVFILALVGSSFAQTSKIGVELNVGADQSIKSEVESYIRRELRSLSDIDLYSVKPVYEITVLVIEPGSAVVMSVVVTRKYDFTSSIYDRLRNTNTSQKIKEDLVKLLAIQSSESQHFIRSDARSNLEELCKSIVTSIDSKSFETDRQFDRLAERYLNPGTPQDSPVPKTTTKPVTSVDSPFVPEYVGGEKTVIRVKNDTDRLLTLVFGGVKYTVVAGGQRDIDIEGGRYEYSASVPNARAKVGVAEFAKGYRWSWRFFIVVRRV